MLPHTSLHSLVRSRHMNNAMKCEHCPRTLSARHICHTGPCYISLQTKLTQQGDQEGHSKAADQATLAAMHWLDVSSTQLHSALLSLTQKSHSRANHAAQSIATFLDYQDELPELSDEHREACCHLHQAASSEPDCTHLSHTTPSI